MVGAWPEPVSESWPSNWTRIVFGVLAPDTFYFFSSTDFLISKLSKKFCCLSFPPCFGSLRISDSLFRIPTRAQGACARLPRPPGLQDAGRRRGVRVRLRHPRPGRRRGGGILSSEGTLLVAPWSVHMEPGATESICIPRKQQYYFFWFTEKLYILVCTLRSLFWGGDCWS